MRRHNSLSTTSTQQLPKLKVLNLRNNNLSPKSLMQFSELKNLEELDVSMGEKIVDPRDGSEVHNKLTGGLFGVKDLLNLKKLTVRNTDVSIQDIEILRCKPEIYSKGGAGIRDKDGNKKIFKSDEIYQKMLEVCQKNGLSFSGDLAASQIAITELAPEFRLLADITRVFNQKKLQAIENIKQQLKSSGVYTNKEIDDYINNSSQKNRLFADDEEDEKISDEDRKTVQNQFYKRIQGDLAANFWLTLLGFLTKKKLQAIENIKQQLKSSGVYTNKEIDDYINNSVHSRLFGVKDLLNLKKLTVRNTDVSIQDIEILRCKPEIYSKGGAGIRDKDGNKKIFKSDEIYQKMLEVCQKNGLSFSGDLAASQIAITELAPEFRLLADITRVFNQKKLQAIENIKQQLKSSGVYTNKEIDDYINNKGLFLSLINKTIAELKEDIEEIIKEIKKELFGPPPVTIATISSQYHDYERMPYTTLEKAKPQIIEEIKFKRAEKELIMALKAAEICQDNYIQSNIERLKKFTTSPSSYHQQAYKNKNSEVTNALTKLQQR
ncbi:530_t:CDS:2 [Entrophospora sp. SA101]|nr:530_t:CDS:2 [Entrophospora sp. SA101]